MLLQYKSDNNYIWFRVDNLEECKELFESFCSARSSMRERIKLEECKVEYLEDNLGYTIDRILKKKKHYYRYDGRNVLLYLSKGYNPPKTNEILH